MILLPLQAAVAGYLGLSGNDPWPVLTMPGFRHAYSLDRGFTLRKPSAEVIYSDGSRRNLDWDELFDVIPPTHHKETYRLLFAPRPGGTYTPVNWLRERADAISENGRASRLVVVWHDVLVRRDSLGLSFENVNADSIVVPLGSRGLVELH
jgi:hypothetical protein